MKKCSQNPCPFHKAILEILASHFGERGALPSPNAMHVRPIDRWWVDFSANSSKKLDIAENKAKKNKNKTRLFFL